MYVHVPQDGGAAERGQGGWGPAVKRTPSTMTPLSLAPPQDLVASDENLAGHEEHLKYRYQQFLATKDAIDQNEGGLLEFSKV